MRWFSNLQFRPSHIYFEFIPLWFTRTISKFNQYISPQKRGSFSSVLSDLIRANILIFLASYISVLSISILILDSFRRYTCAPTIVLLRDEKLFFGHKLALSDPNYCCQIETSQQILCPLLPALLSRFVIMRDQILEKNVTSFSYLHSS